nr:hypothetical protein [Pandoravirus massiliensis]
MSTAGLCLLWFSCFSFVSCLFCLCCACAPNRKNLSFLRLALYVRLWSAFCGRPRFHWCLLLCGCEKEAAVARHVFFSGFFFFCRLSLFGSHCGAASPFFVSCLGFPPFFALSLSLSLA